MLIHRVNRETLSRLNSEKAGRRFCIRLRAWEARLEHDMVRRLLRATERVVENGEGTLLILPAGLDPHFFEFFTRIGEVGLDNFRVMKRMLDREEFVIRGEDAYYLLALLYSYARTYHPQGSTDRKSLWRSYADVRNTVVKFSISGEGSATLVVQAGPYFRPMSGHGGRNLYYLRSHLPHVLGYREDGFALNLLSPGETIWL
jgi:hypothetical protein